MKVPYWRTAGVTASLVLALGHTDIALAHTQTGALGRSANATDLYLVECSTDVGGTTARLRARVLSRKSGLPLVSVQTHKGSVATNRTDAVGGNPKFSTAGNNFGGDGQYLVLVDKAGKGAVTYTIDFHCQAGDGSHTGTDITTLQNQ
jgi:hypothetical protein